ncbi:MAG TPA: dihydrofolate reductase [Steroidobacteraceae bacterium]|nr:dihydrofolate reductase [Steroidobacteraceae bacterium]
MDHRTVPGRLSPGSGAVEFVVAVAENDVIGRNDALPWRLPDDLRRFKAITLGNTVLMGRKTHESIGRALPGRRNLVLTRRAQYAAEGCIAVGGLEEAERAALPDRPIMVIGGGEIFRLCLPFASRIHLTLVHAHFEDGDAYFAGWRGPQWRESAREPHLADDRHTHAYSFVTLLRS